MDVRVSRRYARYLLRVTPPCSCRGWTSGRSGGRANKAPVKAPAPAPNGAERDWATGIAREKQGQRAELADRDLGDQLLRLRVQ